MSYILKPYDDALENILNNGVLKHNRTGIDTLSIFGMQCRYKIDEHFPVLTGRKVWPKSIFAELLWFLSGSTNNKDLQAMGSNIWTSWVDKDFEQENMYVDGALGPIYGFQLRNFGGTYISSKKTDDGFDQLEYMVKLLKEDPDSRRNLFSLWNPNDLNQQRLACCHYSFQVYVHDDRLSGMLTQRSADMYIGVPSNIYFYSALIYMLAQQTGYQPYEFIHSIGDAHLYFSHIEAAKEYLSREKPSSPKLNLNKAQDIYNYKLEDFELLEYNPLKPIKVDVMI